MNTEKSAYVLPAPWDRLFPLASRLIVWGILASVIYIMRSFFLLVFLTFVFAYVQSGGVNHFQLYIRHRTVCVVLVTILFLSTLTALGLFVFPKVQKQAAVFVNQFSTYIGRADDVLLDLGHTHPLLYEVMPKLKALEESRTLGGHPPKTDARRSPTAAFLQDLAGFGEEADGHKAINQILNLMGDIGSRFAAIASAFLLALLFSFLIVLDLPRLSRSVVGLRDTKLRFIYDEVSDNISEFSHVLGQAFEAQFFIAVANTLLTATGVYMLGLGKSVAFLSVIVFFCSFIPVAGVFISSVPICLMALQTSGGLRTVILAVLLIILIHLIEGYILNPRIYGSRMRINPVIVLIILTISGKLFHFWGLILGVPVCTYFFGHAIRFRKKPDRRAIRSDTVYPPEPVGPSGPAGL